MKQDLKHSVNSGTETDERLPQNHREEFLMKLNTQNNRNSKRYSFLKIASVVLLIVAIGVASLIPIDNQKTKDPLLLQLEVVEKEYLKQIDVEWEQFVTLTTDDRLKQRFEQKLDELQIDYLSLTSEFKNDPNNLLILESLINNLQTRLQLLRDIQKHINLINQKNEQNENSL